MSVQASRYNIFGVEDFGVSFQDIFDSDWVDVVYQNSVSQFELWMSKIAAVISNDYVVSEIQPLARMIEYLIQVSIVSERVGSDSTSNLQILIPFDERWDCNQFRVTFNTHLGHHHEHLGTFA